MAGATTPNPYISDYVTRLRAASKAARDVFFSTAALRKEAGALGYDAAIAADDLAGTNADLATDDVAAVEAFYAAVDAQFAAHPEQFAALLKLARGVR